eukprot:gnl/TRDRNA2_/TRDRNA2_92856_c0_seq1.p1 gnl/TRDRNA2_/TRDRNA2_92856_c0~~gnl/TRDRNA2_/TRDRNA2_92856_c0_seq1.p1  ORF type:complete len:453 (-),score=44.55 gnl/TRDRNA2_/TRDRNA2_92856_c0_seq1:64-1398(-)
MLQVPREIVSTSGKDPPLLSFARSISTEGTSAWRKWSLASAGFLNLPGKGAGSESRISVLDDNEILAGCNMCTSPGCRFLALPGCASGAGHELLLCCSQCSRRNDLLLDMDDHNCDCDGHSVDCSRLAVDVLRVSWWETCRIDMSASDECACLVVPPIASEDIAFAEPLPVILFLAGIGHVDDREHFLSGGVDLLLRNPLVRQNCIVVAPKPTSCSGVLGQNRRETGKAWDPDGVMAIFLEVLRRLGPSRVDTGRLYITGLSLGASGVWRVLSRYGQYFAAGVPICGPCDWPRDAWPDGEGPSDRIQEIFQNCSFPIRAYEIGFEDDGRRLSPEYDICWLNQGMEARSRSFQLRGMDPGSQLQVEAREFAAMELWRVKGPLQDWEELVKLWGGDSHCLWYRVYPFVQWGFVDFLFRHTCPVERQWKFEGPQIVLGINGMEWLLS